jgi:peptidoglycan/LPS O-acetylase OafA/YrhL
MAASSSKLEGLQAARAVAALSVAYFHSYVAVRWFPASEIHPIEPFATWGFLGVPFFFAISGYVICVVTDRSTFTTASFALKRIFRLFPLVILFCIFQYQLEVYQIVSVTADHSLSRILYGMSLLPGSGERYYAVTWTLEHELIFYAMAAIIVPLFGRWGLGAALFALAAIAYLFAPAFWKVHLFTTVHADFLAGVLAYQLRDRLRTLGLWIPLGLGLACYWLGARGYLPFGIPIGSVFLLSGLINARWPWGRWPLRGAVALGDASYSIYLSHWILLYLSNRLAWGIEPTHIPAELWRFGTLAVICVVSIALWRFFERPMIAVGEMLSRRASRRPTVIPSGAES